MELRSRLVWFKLIRCDPSCSQRNSCCLGGLGSFIQRTSASRFACLDLIPCGQSQHRSLYTFPSLCGLPLGNLHQTQAEVGVMFLFFRTISQTNVFLLPRLNIFLKQPNGIRHSLCRDCLISSGKTCLVQQNKLLRSHCVGAEPAERCLTQQARSLGVGPQHTNI